MLDDGATANVMLCLGTSSVQAARYKGQDLLSPRHGPSYLGVNRLGHVDKLHEGDSPYPSGDGRLPGWR